MMKYKIYIVRTVNRRIYTFYSTVIAEDVMMHVCLYITVVARAMGTAYCLEIVR
jgi:hypothetical protein